MKIAAYIIAAITTSIWGFLLWIGCYLLFSWHQENGYQPTIGDVFSVVLVAVAAFAAAPTSIFFLRRQLHSLFVFNCLFLFVTIVGGVAYITQFAAGV